MKIIADEIKGMQLSEFLKMLPKRVNIAIGSKTAFFYIGQVQGFAKEAEGIYATFRRQAERAIGRARFTDRNDREWALRYLTESIPFMDRKIVRIYPRNNPHEPYIINCIVEGEEIGRYWLLKEYAEGRPSDE